MDNRRRSVVINKQFQYQYSLLIVGLTVLLTNLAIIVQSFLPPEVPLVITTSQAIWLGAIEFLLILGVWYGSLKATHKIAGPVFVFSREIAKLGRGDLTAEVQLRQTDMFQDVACEINESLAALNVKISKVKRIATMLESAQADQQAHRELLKALHSELAELTTKKQSQPLKNSIAQQGGEAPCIAR
jgi:methyl-accepting chemotaxis protein